MTYGTGGRWGQWAHGGGSSLELINPNTNHRLAANWADSDETMKSAWTNLEFTGVLDNGANYSNGPINLVQVGLLDVGECLVDNLEVRPGGTNGVNIIANGTFEAGLTNWTPQGDHVRSSLETATGLGGYQSSQSLHLRSSDGFWTLADYVQGVLTQTTLAAGQTATLRLKARWLHGWPEVLMRLRGNWLEVTGQDARAGQPRHARACATAVTLTNAGPAIYEVKHSPAIPAANQPVVVTARFHDINPFQPTLLYRIDTGVNPTPAYTRVADGGQRHGRRCHCRGRPLQRHHPRATGGHGGRLSGPGQDAYGATTIFPADLNDNAGVPRECVVGFGDPMPDGQFQPPPRVHHAELGQPLGPGRRGVPRDRTTAPGWMAAGASSMTGWGATPAARITNTSAPRSPRSAACTGLCPMTTTLWRDLAQQTACAGQRTAR